MVLLENSNLRNFVVDKRTISFYIPLIEKERSENGYRSLQPNLELG